MASGAYGCPTGALVVLTFNIEHFDSIMFFRFSGRKLLTHARAANRSTAW